MLRSRKFNLLIKNFIDPHFSSNDFSAQTLERRLRCDCQRDAARRKHKQ